MLEYVILLVLVSTEPPGFGFRTTIVQVRQDTLPSPIFHTSQPNCGPQSRHYSTGAQAQHAQQQSCTPETRRKRSGKDSSQPTRFGWRDRALGHTVRTVLSREPNLLDVRHDTCGRKRRRARFSIP
uniref:Uncharacterized protein n=1 Tax=Anopheles melas TaxID=34690 RepID=A0A182TU08_9DIPT